MCSSSCKAAYVVLVCSVLEKEGCHPGSWQGGAQDTLQGLFWGRMGSTRYTASHHGGVP